MTKKKQNSSAKHLVQNDLRPGEAHTERSVDGAFQATPVTESESAAVYETEQRLIGARKTGPDRPLAQLVKAEADLEPRSQALQALSPPKQKRPDKDLLIHQLTQAVNTSRASRTIAPKIRRDTILLFSALDSSDVIESILDRHIVTMSNGAMECQARAAFAGHPKSLDIYLRHVEKMTRVLIDLIEARERRRRPKQVVIGNVNVEAGGQAIVGNVEAPKKTVPPRKGNRLHPSREGDEDTGN